MTTPNLKLTEWSPSQDQPHVTVNEALHLLDATIQLSVISDALDTPPGAPSEGDRYIVAATATGAWVGWENSIALYSGGVWLRITPAPGWLSWVGSESSHYRFNAGLWSVFSATSAYDFGIAFGGTPLASEVMGRLSLARAVTCLANFSGSVGHVGVNPTSSFAIDVQDDGASIGTITIATDGSFTFVSTGGLAVSIGAGSLITFLAPAGVDATIVDITTTLFGEA